MIGLHSVGRTLSARFTKRLRRVGLLVGAGLQPEWTCHAVSAIQYQRG